MNLLIEIAAGEDAEDEDRNQGKPAGLAGNRVCVLLGDGVEKPSDYDGVVYIPYDSHDGWMRKLVGELQAANVPVSSNWWR